MRFLRDSQVRVIKDGIGRSLIYIPAKDSIKVLNIVGTVIWEYCDGAHSIEDIVDTVTRSFEGVSREQARVDVRKFTEVLAKEGLIQRV